VADEQVPQGATPKPAKRNVSPEIIGAAALAIILLIFIVQNDTDVKVSWVVFSRRAALWTVILVSAVLGYLIGQLVEFGLKRRRRNHQKDQSRG
jgi:uncharacterized integral membrane protein